jgi:hypothetical protein
MASAIDFRTLPQNVPSICIPRVFPNINETRIRKVFDELNMGIIERIDIVSKSTEKGEKFNRVFIHFKKWNSEGNAEIARERLLNGKDIKIIYDDPWFWKVSAYRKPVASDPRQKAHKTNVKPYKKPTIEFDSDEDRRPSSSTSSNTKFRKSEIDRKTTKPQPRSPSSSPPQPRSPSSSPPPQRTLEIQEDEDTPPPLPKLDYGKITVPKKRTPLKKKFVQKAQTIQQESSQPEVSINIESIKEYE